MDLGTRRRIGGVMWGLGVVVALAWGASRTSTVEARGIGFAPPVRVAAVESGRLLTVHVQLHQAVEADDVVAQLDPAPLVAEREVVSAQLLAIQSQVEGDVLAETRRFAQGLESTLLGRAQILSDLRASEAELEALAQRLSVEEDLLASGGAARELGEEVRRQMTIVEARIVAGREALGIASQAADAARSRADHAPAPNEWLVVAAARQLEAIDARVERTSLVAGIHGQVTSIYSMPGEVVAEGAPVLQITRFSTPDVLAYVDVSRSRGLAPGGFVRVARATGELLEGTLLSVGAGPQPLPPMLWRNPAQPEWGVPVRIQLTGGEIAPDEPVVVRL